MTLILDRRFPRMLDALLAGGRAGPLEIWSFDVAAERRAYEARFKARGVRARIRSAYKPLLHAFLEEIKTETLIRAEIRHPVHPAAAARRFQQEAYPLVGLFPRTEFVFQPAPLSEDLNYRVTLTWADGRGAEKTVFAPNRVHLDPAGAACLSPTGWLRSGAGPGERVETELEALFAAALAAVEAQDLSGPEPWFEELHLRALIPMPDESLNFGEEVLSLQEALHEDLYFSLLEQAQRRAGRPRGARDLRPGQIVPEIGLGPAEFARLVIATRPLDGEDPQSSAKRVQDLDRLTKAPAPDRVARELAALGGLPFEARSRAGRISRGVYVQGPDAPLLISGGQHANETTGVVGALRAARALAAREGAHFAVSPLENPDGYALHRRLVRENPRHMHHAARYTAWGDDLERRASDAEPAEAAIRAEALKLCGARAPRLHVNLHGYPAHEWTRPFSGYLPRGFESWTLPKGFFLILRHRPGAEAFAEGILTRVAGELARSRKLLSFTEAQMRLAEAHAGPLGFRLVEGFPCLVSVEAGLKIEVQLITEYPDETIHGRAFVAGHEAQMRTVLAAYEALQALSTPGA